VWGRGLIRGAATVAAVAVGLAFASTAQANDYPLSQQLVSRGNPVTSFDNGYIGPDFQVGQGGTSTDHYTCPPGQVASNWLVVADDADSNTRHWTSNSDLVRDVRQNEFEINATNWSLAPEIHLRLAASCTDDPNTYPWVGEAFHYLGDYQGYWDDQFTPGNPATPTPAAFGGLIERAFCWSPYPGCTSGVGVRRKKRHFALHDGRNRISLTFRQPAQSLRPPVVRLAGAAGCRARRMPLSAQDGVGQLTLVLRCHGLKRGAAARVRIRPSIRRTFRLRQGRGATSVRLRKPAGTVQPMMHVTYGRPAKPCRRVRPHLRLRSRTFSLRVSARCGRRAGNTVGHLDVGGLLAARR
jgi:hypothetical protein